MYHIGFRRLVSFRVPRPCYHAILTNRVLYSSIAFPQTSSHNQINVNSAANKFQVLLDQLVLEPQTVRTSLLKLRDLYGEKEFHEKVTKNVQLHFNNDPYNLSLFQCLTASPSLSKNVNKHLKNIIGDTSSSDLEKANKISEYLTTLASIIPPNTFEFKLTLQQTVQEELVSIIPRSYFSEFFILLLQVNCEFRNNYPLTKIVYLLRTGSANEVYTFLNARLPFQKPSYNPDLMMENNYTYSMLSNVLRVYNRLQNSQLFSKIISIMFQKIEDDKSHPKHLLLSRAYEHLIAHIVARYNLSPALLLLQDMQNNGIPISNRLLMILLNRLSFDSDLKNFAIFTNYILDLYREQKQEMDYTTVQVITNQMLKVMQNSQFAHADLKVIIGYTLSFFKKSEPLLRQLGILSLNDDEGNFPRADINDQLNVLKYPPITSMEQVYKACFRYMNFNKTMTLSKLKELYVYFRNTVVEVQEQELPNPELLHHPFSSQNLNEKILKLFMRQLLYRFSNFEGAGELLDDFNEHVDLKILPNSYLYDMMIGYYLRKDDAINAFMWFDKMMNRHQVKANMRPLVKLIVTSYELGSANSHWICSKLIKEHFAPLVNANVHTKHLNPKLRAIIQDLELESHFDMDLPDQRSPKDVTPGRNLAHEMNLEHEFNAKLIDSLRSDFASDVDVMFESDAEVVESSDSRESNFKSQRDLSPIAEKQEAVNVDEEIFEVGDLESADEGGEHLSNIFKKELDVPSIEYTEKLDKVIHEIDDEDKSQLSFQNDSIPPTKIVNEISSISSPSYQRIIRENTTLYKKRKQFVEMLSKATNDDIVILLLKFLQKSERDIVFFRSNKDYRDFKVSKASNRKKNRRNHKN